MNDIWNKFTGLLGLAESESSRRGPRYLDELEPEIEDMPPNIRKLTRSDSSKPQIAAVANPMSKLHIIEPTSFDDARQIVDKLNTGTPVIMNLQSLKHELSQRIMDFVSGAGYSMGGRVQPVGDKVMLITPASVEVSAEERRILQESSYIFNSQSKGSARGSGRQGSKGNGHRRGMTHRPRI